MFLDALPRTISMVVLASLEMISAGSSTLQAEVQPDFSSTTLSHVSELRYT
jgi:hypothetical protein